jgi:drug/metabolite transporter (DMT)-like permease
VIDAPPEVRPRLGVAAAAVAVVVWGASAVLIKQVPDLNGLAVACYRIWLGAGLVTAAFVVSGGRITRRLLRRSLYGGLTFLADLVLFFVALDHTSVANASVIGALQPLLVLLVANRLFGEQAQRAELLWGAVAIAGAAVVVLGGDGGGANSLGGDLFAVGALLAWTAYFVATKEARRHLGAFEYLTGMSIVAAIAVIPLALLFRGSLGGTTAGGWATIVAITVINGLLGHFLMSWAHGHASLLTVSLLTLAIPVVGAATAAVFIDEPVTAVQVIGMIGVVAALALVTLSTARRAPALVEADLDALEPAPHP